MDFADYGALQTIKWTLADTPAAPPGLLYIQLHVGDPGADGTQNPAANVTRQSVLFASSTNIGVDGRAQAVTNADITWLAVIAAETYAFISLWDAATAGNCWYKGPMLAPVAVAAGSNFIFPAGSTLDHA